MNTFLRNTISKLYNAVSALVVATGDALAERLQGVHETASLLYKRIMENMGYGQKRSKDIAEKETEEEEQQQEEEAKEQQDDDEGYDAVAKIKLYEGKRLKEFRVTGNLHNPNTRMIMANITPYIEMRTNVFYSFKSEVHRGVGDIVPYNKTINSPPSMFTSLKEIQAYIEECEQKWLDLDDEEVWSRAYLPAKRTTEVRDSYEGKVIFKHVQIRLVASNEPLMG